MPRAPKACSTPGCSKLVPQGGECPEHPRRQWDKSRSTIDRSDTKARRALKSNHVGPHRVCALHYPQCTRVATELDRIDNRGGYTDGNVQGVCHPCHLIKTSREGNAAQGHNVRHIT